MNNEDKYNVGWEQLDKEKFATYGISTIVLVQGAFQPMRVLKTQLQVLNAFQKGRKSSLKISSLFNNIMTKEGVRGLYRGFVPCVVGAIIADVVYYSSIELCRHSLRKFYERHKIEHGVTMEAMRNFISGAFADVSSNTMQIPFEVIANRLMIQNACASVEGMVYKGMRDATIKIYKRDGIRGFFRGLGAALCTYIPEGAIWWGTYYHLRNHFLQTYKETHFLNFCLGAAAETVASVCTHPLDVITTRIQVQDFLANQQNGVKSFRYNNFISGLYYITQTEGYLALFKGLSMRLSFHIPTAGVIMVIYEYIKKLSRKQLSDS